MSTHADELRERLDDCVNAGLIRPAQAERIAAVETGPAPGRWSLSAGRSALIPFRGGRHRHG